MSRLYPEIEGGYECCSPSPLPNSRNVSGWEFRTHTSPQGVHSQTARDVAGADNTAGGVACTAVAFTTSQVRALCLSAPFLCNGGKSRLCVLDRYYAGTA